jgi:hypothetical protein
MFTYRGEYESLQTNVALATELIQSGLTRLVRNPNYWSLVGAGDDQLFDAIMKKMQLSIGKALKTTRGRVPNTHRQWLETNNPNIVIQEVYILNKDNFWHLGQRSLIIAGDQWLQNEGLLAQA